MGCNLMCACCCAPMDPSSTAIRCPKCGTKYKPGAVKNRDLQIEGSEGFNFYDKIDAEDVVDCMKLSQRFIIERTKRFLMKTYGLSKSEANRLVKVKILGYE